MIYLIRRFWQDCTDFCRIAARVHKRPRIALLALYIAQFNGPKRYYRQP